MSSIVPLTPFQFFDACLEATYFFGLAPYYI